MHRKIFAVVIMFVVSRGTLSGEPNDQYFQSELPVGSKKLAPFHNRDGGITFSYLDVSGNVVAREEMYPGGKLKSRDLFSDGKTHGVQRAWFKDGKLELEAPYKQGVMNGVFRIWDQSGRLVANYRIDNGNGVERVFYSSGGIRTERHYESNVKEGTSIQFFENGHPKSFNRYTKGKLVGPSIAFFENSSIRCLGIYSEGALNGPLVRFDDTTNAIESVEYWIKGKRVSSEEYQTLAKDNAQSPQFRQSAQEYKEWAIATAKKVEDEIGQIPRLERGP